jgi:hypothetical protein
MRWFVTSRRTRLTAMLPPPSWRSRTNATIARGPAQAHRGTA